MKIIPTIANRIKRKYKTDFLMDSNTIPAIKLIINKSGDIVDSNNSEGNSNEPNKMLI